MPEVRKSIFLNINPDMLLKHLDIVLLKLRARIKNFSKYLIHAEHGSYTAIFPSNYKKEIQIEIMEFKDGVKLDLTIYYTKSLLLVIASMILSFVIGYKLYEASLDSLAYFDLLKQGNPIIMFINKPWLLDTLSNVIDDLDVIEYILYFILIFSIGLIVSGIIDIIYVFYFPFAFDKFADNIIREISFIAQNVQTTSYSREEKNVIEIDNKNRQTRGILQQPYFVHCIRSSESYIICTVKVENIDKESLIKSLAMLGFNLYKVNEDIYIGEKQGTIFSTGFLDKKIKIRIIFYSGKVNIVFETSQWSPFTEKDREEAEKVLFSILS